MLLMNLGISWGLLGDFGDYLAIFRRFQMKWISIWFLQLLQPLEEGFIFSNLPECSNYLRWLFVECLNGRDTSQSRHSFCHFERSEKSPQFEFVCNKLPAKVFVCSKFDFIVSRLVCRQWNARKIGVKI